MNRMSCLVCLYTVTTVVATEGAPSLPTSVWSIHPSHSCVPQSGSSSQSYSALHTTTLVMTPLARDHTFVRFSNCPDSPVHTPQLYGCRRQCSRAVLAWCSMGFGLNPLINRLIQHTFKLNILLGHPQRGGLYRSARLLSSVCLSGT